MSSAQFWLIWDLLAIMCETCMRTANSSTEEEDEETRELKLPVGGTN